ncbi:MAG: hypothetical protein HFH35_06310 [Eubacterium sp.]|nr:hypothetical protein [Eubacterium sp.]
MKLRWSIAAFVCLLLLTFAGTQNILAAVVEPTGDREGKQDHRLIMDTLASDGEVRLKSGKTYYIKKPLQIDSNQKLYAKGAKIICLESAFRSKVPTKDNYRSVKNITVDGGTWTHIQKEGTSGTMIQFAHGQNITVKNVKVSANYKGHGIELIAVKDVVIDHCTVTPLGSCPADCHEEQIQIDIATPATAPAVASHGAHLVKGQVCENVTVKNCTVSGARGICANFTLTENGKYRNRFHKNIVIKNNRIQGKTGEALALFNVMGAVVEGNQIITTNNKNESYAAGLHIAMFGKAPAGMDSAVLRVKKNVIKGGSYGMLVFSNEPSSQFGKLDLQNNKCYAKAGRDKAYEIHYVKKVRDSNNKKYAWS